MNISDVCGDGDINQLRKLIYTKPDIVNINNEIDTLLHLASCYRYVNIIRSLLKSRTTFDVNVQNENGNTPLRLASFYGHIEIVRLLLENGASKHIENNIYKTPIDISTNDEIRRILENWSRTKPAI